MKWIQIWITSIAEPLERFLQSLRSASSTESQPPSSAHSPANSDWPVVTEEEVEEEGIYDLAVFFDRVRREFGRLKQSQVDGLETIIKVWSRLGTDSIPQLAYILATAWHETGGRMVPVREGHGKTDKQAYNRVYRYLKKRGRIGTMSDYVSRHSNGHSYYGRGPTQLTWYRNYLLMGHRLGIDLINNPDLALDPVISVKILIVGMLEGVFTRRRLSRYINNTRINYVDARRVVNGTDRARDIATYATDFESALKEAKHARA